MSDERLWEEGLPGEVTAAEIAEVNYRKGKEVGIREGERRERARVVAWLRRPPAASYSRWIEWAALMLERGDHEKTEGGGE